MKETEFLGTLMPAHPDLIPIIEAMRKKPQPKKSPRTTQQGIVKIYSDR